MVKHGRTWRVHDLVFLCALLVLVVLFFWPVWRKPEGMWYAPGADYSDLTITHWPNWWFVRQSVRQYGQVPLWRPAILGGAPLVGHPLAALFYPPNWLGLLLPLAISFHVQYTLHAFGAGAALYALARWGYGRSPFAAFFGALGYALTPKWVAHLGAGHIGICQAYAWLPLIAWSLRACLRSYDPDQRSAPVAPGMLQAHGMESAATDARGRSPGAKATRLRGPSPSGWVRGRLQPQRGYPFSVGLRTFACGAALALTYLAFPLVAFYGAAMAAGYAVYRLAGTWRRSGWRSALTLALYLSLIPLAFALLAAIQILPTAELMPMTTRSVLTLEETAYDSLPWRYLLGYLIADRSGHHEWMTYLGLLPVGLSALGLIGARERDRWFWIGLALLALLYALGTNSPLFTMLYRLLPALGWVRVPPRALFLVALAANLLASFGIDVLPLRSQRGRPWVPHVWTPRAQRRVTRLAIAGLLTCAGLGIGFAALYGRQTPPAALALAAVGAAAFGVCLLSFRPRVPGPLVQAMLLVLLIADQWPVGRSLIELRSEEQVFGPGAAAATYLSRQTTPRSPSRIYSPSYSVPQHVGARIGLEQINGIDPLQLHWVVRYVSLATGIPPRGYSVTLPPFPRGADVRTAWQDATPDAALLGALNVCAVAAEFQIEAPGLVLETQIEGTYIYRNQRCLPRAYLVTRAEPVDGWQEAQNTLRGGFDPTQGALVEGGEALNGPAGWQAAIVREHTPNRLVVEAEAGVPSLLVLAEVWASGWQVTVDGVEQPYHRVNGVTRGVYLAPGTHTVVWRYRPAALRWGAVLTAGAYLTLALGAIWLGICQRSRGAR